jgi:predicted Zn-dependent protease
MPRACTGASLPRSPNRPVRPLARLALALGALSTVALTPMAQVRAQTQSAPSLIRDTEIEETLHAEADPIFVAAGLSPKDVSLLIVGDKEMNAGTGSGQLMAVNTGLIEKTETPGQLQGVIAHEAGHAAGGHPVRSGEMMRAGLAPLLLTMGLGILAAAAGSPDAAAALIGSAPGFGQLNMLKYSREQEARADQAAITYLERAGLSSKGLVDFFENFRYEEVFSEARRYPFFVDHPISSERIDLLRRRAEEQKHFAAKDAAELVARHEIMKAKLKAFTDPPAQTYATYKDTDPSFPARYARAIAYYKALETDRALKSIDALIADQPSNPYLWELKGQVLLEASRPKEAEPAHRRSVELKPEAPLLQVNLAQAILAQDSGRRADEAIPHLQKAITLEKDNAFAWKLLAQAYDAKGLGGDARLATAEERFSVGDLPQARVFALRAREQLKRDTPQWRRAADIVMVSKPSSGELKTLARQTGLPTS